jgi:hypothetical protein
MAGVRVSRAASSTSFRVRAGVVGIAGWRGMRGMELGSVSRGWTSGGALSVVVISRMLVGLVASSLGWRRVFEPMVRTFVSVLAGSWGEASKEVTGPWASRSRARMIREIGLRVIGQRF